jgi:hypothetical protein
MNAHSSPSESDHLEASRSFQEYYDTAMREVGVRIPAPVLGMTTNQYRRKTLAALQRALLPRSHDLARVDFNELKADALQVIEPQTLDACKAERINPNNVPVGEIKPIKVFDQYGRVQMTKFIGQESFVKTLGRPGRRVEAFAANGRLFDAKKGSWR